MRGYRHNSMRPLIRAVAILAILCASGVGSYAALPSPRGDIALDARTTKLMSDAATALRTGNLNLALIHLKNAVRLAPNNGTVRAQLGVALLQSGDAATAERELRQARMDNGPEDVVVPLILRAMLVRGRNQELLAEFRDPGPQDQSAAEVLRARAVALQTLGRTAEANAAADRALQLRRDAGSLLTRARLAQRQGDFSLAGRFIDETLKLEPENIDVITMKVSVLKDGGQTQEAVSVVDNLVQRYPNSATARMSRIEISLALKQDAKAKEDIDALSKQAPNSPMVTYLQALLTARTGDAKAAWQQMQRLPPEFVQLQPEFATAIAQVGINSGNLESAGAILTTLISRHPDVTQARFQLALLRLRQKSPEAAITAIGPLANSDNAEANSILAQAYLQLRRFDDAIEALEKALASGDGNDLLKR